MLLPLGNILSTWPEMHLCTFGNIDKMLKKIKLLIEFFAEQCEAIILLSSSIKDR